MEDAGEGSQAQLGTENKVETSSEGSDGVGASDEGGEELRRL